MSARNPSAQTLAELPAHTRVLVVGAGFGGLAAAGALVRDGRSLDVVIIERAGEVGGTWRDNTYPGCACDVPTSLYSLSFAPSPEWSHTFAAQSELFEYLKDVATRSGIRARTLFDCELLGARWDERSTLWRVTTNRGEITAQSLVAASGALSTPNLPDIDGLDTFGGTVFHSAAWNHDHDLTGERIAVVGTGASAIQFVPQIVDKAQRVTVFQRTASWVIPRRNRTLGKFEKSLYRRIPLTQKVVRGLVYGMREAYVVVFAYLTWLLPAIALVSKAQLHTQVRDPRLRRKLKPAFTIGCKRMLLSNEWLPTLARDDVDLVASGLQRVTRTGVVGSDGVERDVDTIIFGTGFTPTEPPIAKLLRGRDGRSLAERWDGSPSAHRGITVSGFPNLFLMYGPNTNLGHSSIVYMLESQASYVRKALGYMESRGVPALEVDAAVQERYADRVGGALATTVWNSGGCSSWYMDKRGRNSVMWPTFTWRYRAQVRSFDAENYRAIEPRPAEEVA
ncbi:NAD(P)/FAD-dependent oxidoreductase [Rhodococcus sp. RD6.2]|uniref:flavin-containing monooxygenase n=1 Tax=Rhodococcus sp. RD6.2 TaxID=260936 RepID=UPI0006797A66|nr:NAD(P)/FAD-dependent oxidoreductase [Rhodococcus sp. RD6.2]